MKINSIVSNYVYNNRKQSALKFISKDFFVRSSVDVKDSISFTGLFSKKVPIPEKTITISSGETFELESNRKVELPDEAFSIHFKSGECVDLNTSELSCKIKLLKEGETLPIVTNSKDDEQVSVYKKDGSLYLENTSKNPITLFSDSCFKNYEEEYLNSKFNRENVPFYILLSDKYNQIRHANYDEKVTFPCGRNVVAQVSKQDKPDLMVFCSDGWLFRIPKYKVKKVGKQSSCAQRISLNVVANPALIEELDNFLLTGKYTDSKNNKKRVKKTDLIGINYKVPYRIESWLKRHDPITIYNSDSFSSDVVEAIASISEKYKRVSVNNVPLVGSLTNKPWIALEKDFTEEDFLKIKTKAEMYSPSFADAMCQHSYEKWNYQDGYLHFSTSTGMFNACRFLLDEYIEYLKHYNNMQS